MKLTAYVVYGIGGTQSNLPLNVGTVYEVDEAHRLVWDTVRNRFRDYATGAEAQTAIFALDGVPFETITISRAQHPVAFHPARIESLPDEEPDAEPDDSASAAEPVMSDLTERAA